MSHQDVDKVLVDRARKGDRKAFDMLVLKYQNRIVQLVSRYISHREDAMDVAQEAFIKAYRALPSFEGNSAFYTWLYRIAVNTAKNWSIAKARRPAKRESELSDSEQHEFDVTLKDQDSPDHLAMRDELERVIRLSIESLPEELRSAIVLREMEGLSYDEIAQIMDCPVGTVRSRIFRAREGIQKRLEPYLQE
ncbi:MAG: RNA polymerase sigma factor RpoE [Gammaproteobacteria bacterium]|nr:MAG: RNA polymerase sigma factor RpoE [Gammaproteobacteria bacterium]